MLWQAPGLILFIWTKTIYCTLTFLLPSFSVLKKNIVISNKQLEVMTSLSFSFFFVFFESVVNFVCLKEVSRCFQVFEGSFYGVSLMFQKNLQECLKEISRIPA